MNNFNSPKAKGFALTQTILAIALGSAVVGGVAYHYQSVHYKSGLVSDANTIVVNSEKSFDAPIKKTWKFTGETFNEGQAFNGTATVDASAKVCAGLKAQLAPLGSVACDSSGQLSFTSSSKVKPALIAGVSKDVPSLPSSTPAPIQAPAPVNLAGTPLAIASTTTSNSANSTPSTPTSFNSVATNSNSIGSVKGGGDGGNTSGGLYSGSGGNIIMPAVSATGTATVTPPAPPMPVLSLGCSMNFSNSSPEVNFLFTPPRSISVGNCYTSYNGIGSGITPLGPGQITWQLGTNLISVAYPASPYVAPNNYPAGSYNMLALFSGMWQYDTSVTPAVPLSPQPYNWSFQVSFSPANAGWSCNLSKYSYDFLGTTYYKNAGTCVTGIPDKNYRSATMTVIATWLPTGEKQTLSATANFPNYNQL